MFLEILINTDETIKCKIINMCYKDELVSLYTDKVKLLQRLLDKTEREFQCYKDRFGEE